MSRWWTPASFLTMWYGFGAWADSGRMSDWASVPVHKSRTRTTEEETNRGKSQSAVVEMRHSIPHVSQIYINDSIYNTIWELCGDFHQRLNFRIVGKSLAWSELDEPIFLLHPKSSTLWGIHTDNLYHKALPKKILPTYPLPALPDSHYKTHRHAWCFISLTVRREAIARLHFLCKTYGFRIPFFHLHIEVL